MSSVMLVDTSMVKRKFSLGVSPVFGLVTAALCALLMVGSASAIEWDEGTHEIYVGDINHDGIQDILLRANRVQQLISVPYQIQVAISVLPEGGADVLLLGNESGTFSVVTMPHASLVGDETWNPGWTLGGAQSIYSDVDGDGSVDLQIKPTNGAGSTSVVVLLARAGSDAPTVARAPSLEPPDVGMSLFPRGNVPLLEANDHSLDGGNIVGRLDGALSVSSEGKLNCSIEIEHSPSVANVLPRVSLDYTGVNHNGLLGVGWSLSVHRNITRCPTILDREGYINGVNFNRSDKFCINGQPLLLANGEYGSDGAEYKTELESFSRIVSHGENDGGPDYFEVRLASGKIEYYGQTDDSRLLNEGGAHRHTWALSRIEDREKNYVEFKYSSLDNPGDFLGCLAQVKGEYLLCEIRYTGNISTAPTNKIAFSYESRSDISDSYANGIERRLRKRLISVDDYLGSEKIGSYKLQYRYGVESRLSQLYSVQRCLSNDACLRPTLFEWNSGIATVAFTTSSESLDSTLYSQGRQYGNSSYQLADIDGNGKKDLLWLYRDVHEFGWVVYKATPDGDGYAKSHSHRAEYFRADRALSSSQKFLVGDFNGDSRDDFVWVGRNTNDFYRMPFLAKKEGDGFIPQGYLVESDVGIDKFDLEKHLVADVNGDGLADIIWVSQYQNLQTISVYHAKLESNGSVSFPRVSKNVDARLSPSQFSNQHFVTGDVNGDGKADLVWGFTYSNELMRVVLLSNANGTNFDMLSLEKEVGQIPNLETIKKASFNLSDVNGDGRDDLVFAFLQGDDLFVRLYLAASGGTNFAYVSQFYDKPNNHSMAQVLHDSLMIRDLNGDGRGDVIYSYSFDNTFGWKTYLAELDGRSFKASSGDFNDSSSSLHSAQEYLLGDVNADFRPDLTWVYQNSSKQTGWAVLRAPVSDPRSQQTYPDHLARITDGLGSSVDVKYAYLSDPLADLYERAENDEYPVRADAGLGFVVSDVYRSDGLGGQRHIQYRYGGARTQLRGRGFLGFEFVTEQDRTQGIEIKREYLQEWPLIGHSIKQTSKEIQGSLLEETYNHWKFSVNSFQGGETYFAYLDDSLVVKRQPGVGKPLAVELKVSDYDFQYGLPRSETRYVASGFESSAILNFDPQGEFDSSDLIGIEKTQLSEFEYSNVESTWRVGFLERHRTTVSLADGTTATSLDQYVPANDHSYLRAGEVKYVGTPFQVATVYENRDSWGNARTTIVNGRDFDGSSLPSRATRFGEFTSGLYPQSKESFYPWNTTQLSYNHRVGKLARSVDPNGQIVDEVYDDLGRLALSKDKVGVETQNTLRFCWENGCPVGAVYLSIQSVGKSGARLKPDVYRYFDSLGRQIQQTIFDFSGRRINQSTQYDPVGRVYAESKPYYEGETPAWVYYEYDRLGRLVLERRPDGSYLSNNYSADGNFSVRQTTAQRIINPLGGFNDVTSSTVYNALNQVVESYDANNTVTKFRYDHWGNLSSTIVNGDASTEINVQFDDAGRKIAFVDPNAGSISFQYDSLGNLRRKVQNPGANQEVETTSYDLLGRIRETHATKSGETVRTGLWEYDSRENGLGLIASMSGPEFTEAYFYDQFSRVYRVETQIQSNPLAAFEYRFDNLGRNEVVIYPQHIATRNHFNALGFLERIESINESRTLWTALDSDRWGNIVRYRTGNGVLTEKQFDHLSGFLSYTRAYRGENGPLIHGDMFVRDTMGNVVRRTDEVSRVAETYTYDVLNRLRAAEATGLSTGNLSRNYDYDALGNIKYKSDVSDVNGYHYGENGAGPHALTRIVNGSNTVSFGYDAKGNMTTNGNKQVSYTTFNLPSDINYPAGRISFKYNPEQKRIYQERVEGSDTVRTYYYNDGKYEEVKRGQDSRHKAYIGDFLIHQTVSRTEGSAAIPVASVYQYVHRDSLGSPTLVLDESGNPIERNLFEPFGARRQEDGSAVTENYIESKKERTVLTTSRGFTDHEQLDSVGLIHMNGRIYDPNIGRFLSPDDFVQFPYFSQSFNRYSYVLNNPVSYTDPSGELLPLIWVVAVGVYKAYNLYESAAGIVEDTGTLLDASASTTDKVIAGASLASSVVSTPRWVKDKAKDIVAVVRTSNSKKVDKADLPNANQSSPDASTTSVSGGCPCCFVAGTLVLTKDGYKPIEQLQIGQLVASKDEKTGEVDWKPVTETFVFDDDRITWLLRISTTDGAEQTFEVTDNHPFWVNEKGWIEVKDLQPGMVLTSYDNKELTVVGLEMLDRSPVTYNVEVADFQSYFAGEQKVWVHNCTCGISSTTVVDPDSTGPVYKANIKQTVDTSKIESVSTRTRETAAEFEKSLVRLPAGERVAKVKEKAQNVAAEHGWSKNNKVSSRNNRDVYEDSQGNLYGVDTQHGRLEKCNCDGKHQNELDFDLNITKSADPKGKHDLVVD